MFYLWPIDRCSNSRTSLCWQSLDLYFVLADSFRLMYWFYFRLGSQVIPTLELIGVGGLLPRMIFHRLEPMFEYPREMGFPYIYIYCISISRVFWRFLTFFARFWILSIFCALYPCFLTFFAGSFFPLWYGHFLDSIFSVPFKEMGFGFYRFLRFLAFF